MEYREDTPDCTLEVKLVDAVECNQRARPRDATPDYELPNHTFPFMLGRRWGDDSSCTTDKADMRPAELLKAVTIGHKPSQTGWDDVLVRAYASITLDRASGAREFHKVYFTAEQWDMIAATLHTDEKIILEGCTIRFDPKDEPVVVDTVEHYDFAEGEGYSTGTFKRYIPGVITDVASILIARKLQVSEPTEGIGGSTDTTEQDGVLFLMNSHELYDAAFPLTDPFLRNGESEYD